MKWLALISRIRLKPRRWTVVMTGSHLVLVTANAVRVWSIFCDIGLSSRAVAAGRGEMDVCFRFKLRLLGSACRCSEVCASLLGSIACVSV